MDKPEYPENRADAQHPNKTNPKKKHVIEKQPTRKKPWAICSPNDVPLDNDSPIEDVAEKMSNAEKKRIANKKVIPPDLDKQMDNPISSEPIY